MRVDRPGFRVRVLVVATTLLDADAYTRDDLAGLYRQRWTAELDLRSLKQTLQMDVLRCRTPELVRKELWTHVLAYNLIRTVMAQAAAKYGVEPRPSASRGRPRRWRRSSPWSPCVASTTQPSAGSSTSVYWTPSRAIASGIGRTGMSPGGGSGGPSRTTAS